MTSAKFLFPALAVGLLLLVACGPEQRLSRLEKKINQTLPGFQSANPSWPEDLSIQQLEDLEQFLGEASADLSNIPLESLQPHRQTTRRQLQDKLTDALRSTNSLRSDPSVYNLPAHWKIMLARQSMPLTERLRDIAGQLSQTQAYYARARAKLRQPGIPQLRLAIDKHVLGIAFLEGELQDSLAGSGMGSRERQAFKQESFQAELAIKDYIAWCNSHLFETQENARKGKTLQE